MLRINQTSPPNSATRLIGVAAMDHTHSSRGSSATHARTGSGPASHRLQPMSFSRCTAARRKTTANGTPTTRVANSLDLSESENKPPTHRSPWYAARPAAPHSNSKTASRTAVDFAGPTMSKRTELSDEITSAIAESAARNQEKWPRLLPRRATTRETNFGTTFR